jgi:ubiquinone/menaquinone biosynthesis C-methylase UbiE
VTDEELRLLGTVAGKRVLQLGGSDVVPAIQLAGTGAHVIVLVPGDDDHERARAAVEKAEAKVELQQVDLADLAFIRADTVDAAYADSSLRGVADLDRVFRQVHRVLRIDAPLLVAVPHPAGDVDTRSYFDRSNNRRTIGDLFASFTRAHFAVDTLLEPESGPVPRRLVLRGRKIGN